MARGGLSEGSLIPKTGLIAWIGLSAYISLWDLFAIRKKTVETMSSANWKLLEHPVSGMSALAIWAAVTYHLYGSKRARSSLLVAYHKVYLKRPLKITKEITTT